MNSFGLNFLEEAASRAWPADSAKIELKPASASEGFQVFSSRGGNKIKAVAAADKYFLTIFGQHFATHERCEPREWLHWK